MSDSDDIPKAETDVQRLAREYVDLWESQIKALSEDEALAKTMAQTMELMNAGAANVAAAMQKSFSDGVENDAASEAGSVATDGAEADGAASGGSEHDLRKLSQRVAELEERLDRLEGLSEPAGKIASPRHSKD